MSQNFREIVQNDECLLKLLGIVDGFDKFGFPKDVEIFVSDIQSICEKIASINTVNPKCHSRRSAWTVTGLLLLGLVTQYEFHVQIGFDECRRLNQSCGRGFFVIEQTKTTKRKIKQSAQTVNKKTKKTNNVEIEYETCEQTVQRATFRFWEEPLQLEKNPKFSQDLNLVPAEQITLREIDEPTIDSIDDDDLDLSFGDEGQSFQFDGDEEMPLIPLARPRQSTMVLDENMNDISAFEFDQEMTSIEAELPAEVEPVASANVTERFNGHSPNSLEKLPPLQPPVIVPKKVNKKKRRSTNVFDLDTVLPNKLMQRRISNVSISCQKPPTLLLKSKQSLKFSKSNANDMFSIPVMNGSIAQTYFPDLTEPTESTDWSIIKDAFEQNNRDESHDGTQNVSHESDILRNESECRIQTRSQNRSHNSFIVPAPATSTPRRAPSRQSIRCSTPQSIDPRINTKSNGLYDFLDDLISPPIEFNRFSGSIPNASIAPPDGFDNINQSDFELSNVSERQSKRRIQNDASEIDQIEDDQLIERPELIGLLGKESLDYTVMSKLLNLWQKNAHPITVENLLTSRSDRFHAAKTFSSLLTLKKKKLVQLENADDGKITHISKGEELNLEEMM